jgi:Lon protease-like protein
MRGVTSWVSGGRRRALALEWQLIQRPPIVLFGEPPRVVGHPKDHPNVRGPTYPEPVEIGLFPLGIVLLPTERVPLHIFEPRYRELVDECIEGDGEFGLVFADEDGIREIGTRARVSDVLERFDDGRLNIVVEGGLRFRVEELTRGRSFMTAEIAEIEDEPGEADGEVATRAVGSFRALAALAGAEAPDPDESSPQLSFELAAQVELPPEAKQRLLESRVEGERLELVAELLDDARVALLQTVELGERAKRNGSRLKD